MPALILDIRIENRGLIKGIGRQFRSAQTEVLKDSADFWHHAIFPKHFKGANRSRYGFAPRNRVYESEIKQKKGQGSGRFVDDVLTGKSARWMAAFFKISGTSKRVTVRMFPPTYFTNPFIGEFRDPRTGKARRVTQQPDKPDEVTRFNSEDRHQLREFTAERLMKRITAIRSTP